MTPTRWEKIEKLYNDALEHSVGERDDFLRLAADDAEMRLEVNSLLAASDDSADFLAESDFLLGWQIFAEENQALRGGQQFGSYKILKFLGSGGMGEVYLAEDAAQTRQIALKVLPRTASDDAERIRRFRREARAASRVVHENIARIYEVGEIENVQFIALEFVDGVTLREFLSNNELSADAVFQIAEQIAAALDAAHTVGVIHRDLKPENVMMSTAGIVKVLDFSIAKFGKKSLLSGGSHGTTIENNETNPVHTQAETIIGTIAYMSPEQVRGQEVDQRTDLWSLGVILYEMLAGELPFAGDTKSDVMAAVLRGEHAPLNDCLPDLPAAVQAIVARALQKNRAERYQTAPEFLIDLTAVRDDFDLSAKIRRQPRVSTSAATLPENLVPGRTTAENRVGFETNRIVGFLQKRKIALTLIALGLSGAAAGWQIVQPRTNAPVSFSAASRGNLKIANLFNIKRKSGGLIEGLAFSPDSQRLAFSLSGDGKTAVYAAPTNGGEPFKVTDGKWNDRFPVWSADGGRIAFVSNRENQTGIWAISSSSMAGDNGGAPVLLQKLEMLIKTPLNFKGCYVKWSPDNRRVAFVGGAEHLPNLWTANADGTGEKQLTTDGIGIGSFSTVPFEFFNNWFEWSPDGGRIAFGSKKSGHSNLWTIAHDGTNEQMLTQNAETNVSVSSPVWSPDAARIAFIARITPETAAEKRLFRLCFVEAGQEKCVFQAETEIKILGWTDDGTEIFAVVKDKTDFVISKIPLAANQSSTAIIRLPDAYPHGIRLSPDKRQIAFSARRDGNDNLFLVSSEGKNLQQLTGNLDANLFYSGLSWSPDNQKLFYSKQSGGLQISLITNQN